MENRVYCLYRVSTRKQADFKAENQADIPMQRNACRELSDRWDGKSFTKARKPAYPGS